jgi:hypothetical protein
MMKRSLAVFLFFLFLFAVPAVAQNSPSAPFVYPRTVNTSAAEVLPFNPQRRRVMFHNPSGTAIIYLCPAYSRVTGTALTCTVGAGALALLPYAYLQLDVISGGGGMPTAWNALSSNAGSPLTILEWE